MMPSAMVILLKSNIDDDLLAVDRYDRENEKEIRRECLI